MPAIATTSCAAGEPSPRWYGGWGGRGVQGGGGGAGGASDLRDARLRVERGRLLGHGGDVGLDGDLARGAAQVAGAPHERPARGKRRARWRMPGRRRPGGGAAQAEAPPRGEPGLLLGRRQRLRRAWAAGGTPSCRGGALGCVGARCSFLRGYREGPRGTARSGRPGRGRGPRPAAVQHHLDLVEQRGGFHVPAADDPAADEADEAVERRVADVPAALAQALDEQLRVGQRRGGGLVQLRSHRAVDDLLEPQLAWGRAARGDAR